MVYVEFFLKASVESKVQLTADRTSEMTSSPLGAYVQVRSNFLVSFHQETLMK